MYTPYPSEAIASQRQAQHLPPPHPTHLQRPHLSLPEPSPYHQAHNAPYIPARSLPPPQMLQPPPPAAPPPSTQGTMPSALTPDHHSHPHPYHDPLPPPRGPGPRSESYELDGKIYELIVLQQPVRARMCGFGDKDRRPITPPPCVRLIVRDAQTKAIIHPSHLETSYYVLTVDLWDDKGVEEQNLVRNPAQSPVTNTNSTNIGSSSMASYAQTVHNGEPGPDPREVQQVRDHREYYASGPSGYSQPGADARYADPSGHSQYPSHPPYSPAHASNYPPPANGYPYEPYQPPPNPYTQPSPIAPAPPYNSAMVPQSHPQQNGLSPANQPTGTSPVYNRNLIGSLSASAFVLKDDKGEPGVWFILQDLSVRQEGLFRLKFSFCDVGDEGIQTNGSSITMANLSQQPLMAGTGLRKEAPIVATCFSDPFQVFSAKKFPGVIASTVLSQTFADQGIKIPIRQTDGGKRKRTDGDSTDEEDGDDAAAAGSSGAGADGAEQSRS